MATYVISDIHGFYNRLIDLLQQINFNDTIDELYILGDIIDRGPHIKEVCEWAYQHKDRYHFLLGNHEDMMLSAFGTYKSSQNIQEATEIWACNGGTDTYFNFLEICSQNQTADFINWVRTWPLFFDISVNGKRFVLTHAGLAVNGCRMLDDKNKYGRQDSIEIEGFKSQYAQSLLWIRKAWYYNATDIPCDVVFGHTPTQYIYNDIILDDSDSNFHTVGRLSIKGRPGYFLHINDKKHAIDTSYNRLGILRLDDMKEFYSDIEE